MSVEDVGHVSTVDRSLLIADAIEVDKPNCKSAFLKKTSYLGELFFCFS